MPQTLQPQDEAELLFTQGYELWNQGQHTEAIAAYAKAAKLKPDYIEAWYYRASGLEELQQYEEALACYDEVVRLEPVHQYAWYRRGILLLTKLQRYEEAIASYDKFIEIQPDDYDAWNGRGDALIELKRYPEAVSSYNRAIQINPTNCWDWCERVLKLQGLQRKQEALSLCKQIATVLDNMAINPDLIDSWLWDSIHQGWLVLGDCLLALHSYSEAVAACDKALQIKPEECLSCYCRAMALEQLQRYQEAAKCYNKAIQTHPDFHEAINGLNRVMSKSSC